jgi:hypothetical protein
MSKPEWASGPRRGRMAITLIGGAVLAIAISGCGGAGSQDKADGPGSSTTGSSGAPSGGSSDSPGQGSASGDASPGSGTSTYHQPVGAIKDLSKVHCAASPAGRWSMTGTLTNQTQKQRTYDVLVAVIKPATSEVLGSKKVSVEVPAGKSAPVKAQEFYHGKSEGVQCTQVVTLHG